MIDRIYSNLTPLLSQSRVPPIILANSKSSLCEGNGLFGLYSKNRSRQGVFLRCLWMRSKQRIQVSRGIGSVSGKEGCQRPCRGSSLCGNERNRNLHKHEFRLQRLWQIPCPGTLRPAAKPVFTVCSYGIFRTQPSFGIDPNHDPLPTHPATDEEHCHWPPSIGSHQTGPPSLGNPMAIHPSSSHRLQDEEKRRNRMNRKSSEDESAERFPEPDWKR